MTKRGRRVFTTNSLVAHIVNRQPRLTQSKIKLIATDLGAKREELSGELAK